LNTQQLLELYSLSQKFTKDIQNIGDLIMNEESILDVKV